MKHDRAIVLGAGGVLVGLAWLCLLLGAGTGMNPLAMTTWTLPPYQSHDAGALPFRAWSIGYALVMLGMWWVMMIAMMLPSATPVMLLYARVARRAPQQTGGTQPLVSVAAFVAGYLVIWLVFSAAATLLELGLEFAGLVSRVMMWSESGALTGGLLVAAGVYQLSPLKRACLGGCRSPAEFLARHRKLGALGMGLVHGAYCVGCCWALMLLLFAGGAMNLLWIAGLTIFVLLEKVAPYSAIIGRVSGIVLLALGAAVSLRSLALAQPML